MRIEEDFYDTFTAYFASINRNPDVISTLESISYENIHFLSIEPRHKSVKYSYKIVPGIMENKL